MAASLLLRRHDAKAKAKASETKIPATSTASAKEGMRERKEKRSTLPLREKKVKRRTMKEEETDKDWKAIVGRIRESNGEEAERPLGRKKRGSGEGGDSDSQGEDDKTVNAKAAALLAAHYESFMRAFDDYDSDEATVRGAGNGSRSGGGASSDGELGEDDVQDAHEKTARKGLGHKSKRRRRGLDVDDELFGHPDNDRELDPGPMNDGGDEIKHPAKSSASSVPVFHFDDRHFSRRGENGGAGSRMERRLFMSPKAAVVHATASARDGSLAASLDEDDFDVPEGMSREEFVQLSKEIEALGARNLAPKESKERAIKSLQELGAKAPKGHRMPVAMAQGIKQKKQERAQKQTELDIAAGMIRVKGSGKAKRRREQKGMRASGGESSVEVRLHNGMLVVPRSVAQEASRGSEKGSSKGGRGGDSGGRKGKKGRGGGGNDFGLNDGGVGRSAAARGAGSKKKKGGKNVGKKRRKR